MAPGAKLHVEHACAIGFGVCRPQTLHFVCQSGAPAEPQTIYWPLCPYQKSCLLCAHRHSSSAIKGQYRAVRPRFGACMHGTGGIRPQSNGSGSVADSGSCDGVWQCSGWFGEWLNTARVRWIELALPQPPPPLSGLCGGGFSCVDSVSAVKSGIVGHYVSVF